MVKCFDVCLLKGMRMGMNAANACVKQWEQVTASLIPQPWHTSFGKRPRRSRPRIFRRSRAPGADLKVAWRLHSSRASLPRGECTRARAKLGLEGTPTVAPGSPELRGHRYCFIKSHTEEKVSRSVTEANK